MTKKTPRESLRAAIDRACVARGEAQWMNGYRAGRFPFKPKDDVELHAKEQAAWKVCAQVEDALDRAIGTFARRQRDNRRTKTPRRRTR